MFVAPDKLLQAPVGLERGRAEMKGKWSFVMQAAASAHSLEVQENPLPPLQPASSWPHLFPKQQPSEVLARGLLSLRDPPLTPHGTEF